MIQVGSSKGRNRSHPQPMPLFTPRRGTKRPSPRTSPRHPGGGRTQKCQRPRWGSRLQGAGIQKLTSSGVNESILFTATSLYLVEPCCRPFP
jgi:hypothetical protein